MEKDLTKLSNGELWKLFPVILTEHDPRWEQRFYRECLLLKAHVGKDRIVRINHIGSTAVPGMIAKPTIDLLMEIEDETDLSRLRDAVEGAGYLFSPQPGNPAPHMMFLKGYTPQGFAGQAYHLHVRYRGDWDEIYFRDWLRKRPEVALAYGLLKQELQKRFEHDRDSYTKAKTDFIRTETKKARAEMGGNNAVEKAEKWAENHEA